jgi:hypothetical protein
MALPKGGHRQRTRLNVADSNGTAILFDEVLKGGSRLTRNLCALETKPYILIKAREIPDPIEVAALVASFIQDNAIEVLNVAGPRASGWLEGYRFAFEVITGVISQARAEDPP